LISKWIITIVSWGLIIFGFIGAIGWMLTAITSAHFIAQRVERVHALGFAYTDIAARLFYIFKSFGCGVAFVAGFLMLKRKELGRRLFVAYLLYLIIYDAAEVMYQLFNRGNAMGLMSHFISGIIIFLCVYWVFQKPEMKKQFN